MQGVSPFDVIDSCRNVLGDSAVLSSGEGCVLSVLLKKALFERVAKYSVSLGETEVAPSAKIPL